MSNEAKQRFLELSVDEVSVVDSPANESDFVVIKSLNTHKEVGEMANKQNVNKDASQVAEQVPVEVEAPDTDAVSKALTQVTDLVANIAKATGAAPAAPEIETPAAPGDGTSKQSTEKSESAPADDAQPAMDEDMLNEAVSKAVEGVFQGLQKARTFTPKREEALKAAIEQLNDLAKELGMTKIPVGQSPPVSTPSGASFGASGVQQLTKALEGVQSVVQSMQDAAKSLGDRLEAVEKTRNPSVAAPSDSNDGDDDEVSTEKSLWKGVL